MSTSPMALRDSDEFPIRVTRAVPVWSIIAAFTLIVAQAVTLQLGQARQGEIMADQSKKISELNDGIRQLSVRVDSLSQALNDAKLQTAKYDYVLADHERRIGAVEAQHSKGMR